jgi:hypothetical protein
LRDNLRPIITAGEFAADLAAAGDQDPEDYHAYGLAGADITRLAADFTRWAAELRTPNIDDRSHYSTETDGVT